MTAIAASFTGQTAAAPAAGGPVPAPNAQGFASAFAKTQAPSANATGAAADPAAATTPLADELAAALARLMDGDASARPDGESEDLEDVVARATLNARRTAKRNVEDATPATASPAPAIAAPTVQAAAMAASGGVAQTPALANSDVQLQTGWAAEREGFRVTSPSAVAGPVASARAEPGKAADVLTARGAKASTPAAVAEVVGRTPKAAGTSPAGSAKAAIALDAGVTALIGEIVAGTPKLETPAALAPPSVSGAQPDTAGGEGSPEGRAEADAKPAAPEAGPQAAKTAKTADGGASAPDDVDPQSPTARADGAAPPAADRAMVPTVPAQTAAAPATPAAQNPQAAAGASAAVAVQVATEVASNAGARRSRFEVRLDPGELGRVDVRLDFAQDGRLATRLIVERPETLDMLRNDARELSRTLEQAGFQLGQGGLSFQLKDGRQGDWRADPASPPHAGAAPVEPDEPTPAAEIYRRAARSGGVDVTA